MFLHVLSLGLAEASPSKRLHCLAKGRSSESTAAEHIMVAPADLKWADAPPSLPPGAKMAVLEGDPGKKGPFTVRLQAPAGYKIPPHTHIPPLSGSGSFRERSILGWVISSTKRPAKS